MNFNQQALNALSQLNTKYSLESFQENQFNYIRSTLGLPKMTFSTESLEVTKDLVELSVVYSNEMFMDYLLSDYRTRFMNDFHQFDASLESFDEHLKVSTEGIGEIGKKILDKIKQLLESLKEGFKKFVTWIKNGFSAIFGKINNQKREIKKVFKLEQTGYLTDEEFQKLISDFFYKFGTSGKQENFVIRPDGRLHNPVEYFPKVKEEINKFSKILDTQLDQEYDKYEIEKDGMDKDVTINFKAEEILNSWSGNKSIEEVLSNGFAQADYTNVKKVKREQFFKDAEKILDNYEATEKFYKETTSKLEKTLRSIEKDMKPFEEAVRQGDSEARKAYDKLRDKARIFSTCMQIAYLPASVSVAIIRLCFYMSNNMKTEEYTTTTKGPTKLLHLSDNENLGDVLEPRIGGTNVGEFLPPRVSFSPEVLAACIGIRRHFLKGNEDGEVDGLYYKDFYLYEGIPEKGVTRYIKPELMMAEFGSMQRRLKETPVTTPIKIKKLGKCRIYYKPPEDYGIYGTMDNYDPSKFVKYEMIEQS